MDCGVSISRASVLVPAPEVSATYRMVSLAPCTRMGSSVVASLAAAGSRDTIRVLPLWRQPRPEPASRRVKASSGV